MIKPDFEWIPSYKTYPYNNSLHQSIKNRWDDFILEWKNYFGHVEKMYDGCWSYSANGKFDSRFEDDYTSGLDAKSKKEAIHKCEAFIWSDFCKKQKKLKEKK